MQDIMCNGLTNTFLTTVLRDYLELQDLEIANYSVEHCSFKTGEGKRKKFYKITVEANQKCPDLILKVLPETDGAIGSTLDYYHREVAFAESDLYGMVAQKVQIPIVAVFRNEDAKEWWVLMEEVSPALKKIGPPQPPKADVVRAMLRNLGKLHALTWEKVNLADDYPWLMDFNQWVRSGCLIIQALIEDQVQEPWIEEVLQDKPGLVSGFPGFLNWLTAERKEILKSFLYSPEKILNVINQSPKAVCHNDLFFSNLGWCDDELLLIDWEFVGIAPAPWDIYSAYAGMPCSEVQEEEALEIYFQAIEEERIEVDREAWVNVYHKLEIVEFLLFGLRTLVPAIFDSNSPLTEERKKLVRAELDRLLGVMEHVHYGIKE